MRRRPRTETTTSRRRISFGAADLKEAKGTRSMIDDKLAIVALVAALAAGAAVACGPAAAPQPAPAKDAAVSGGGEVANSVGGPQATGRVSAVVVAAQLTDIAEIAEASGSTEPWLRVSPGTKIMGRIAHSPARVGARVAAGELLARLESADLEAAVAQARAAAAMAEATLENATANHRRMQTLHAQDSVTDKNLEDATAAWRVAEAGVGVAHANLVAAEVTLGYAEVRSPVSGWLTARMVEAGDMASPGMPLFVIEDLSRIEVVFNVPESVAIGLRPGQAVEVTIGVPGASRTATIDRLTVAADRASRTFEVKVVLDNPDGTIKSGMFARAAFTVGSRTALIVPESAIVRRGELDGVFVVGADGRAALRWVKLGRRSGESVEVLSGLAAGERYLVAPPPGTYDGGAVEASSR